MNRAIVSLALIIILVPATFLRAQEPPPVHLEPLGPSEVIRQVTRDTPNGRKNLLVKKRQFRLTNLSAKNIIACATSFSYTPNPEKSTGWQRDFSYPPEPPFLPAGASRIISDEYFETPQRNETYAHVDFILFGDGSTFGPDRSRTGAAYSTMLQTQNSIWKATLKMLEERGPEATKAFIREKLNQPNPIEKRRPDIK